MSSWTLRFFVRSCFKEWFRISFFFFWHIMSSWTWFRISLVFLTISLFLFFHKNFYLFTKGKEPAQSPKPAVSFPLNPFLLGHGLGHRPKNPPASKVSSVSYEQIRVVIFFNTTYRSVYNKDKKKLRSFYILICNSIQKGTNDSVNCIVCDLFAVDCRNGCCKN